MIKKPYKKFNYGNEIPTCRTQTIKRKGGVLNRDMSTHGELIVSNKLGLQSQDGFSKGSIKDKQVLVTGGAGIIGQELIRKLLAEGAHVRIVDFREKPKGFEDVEYLQMDLSLPESQFMFRYDPEYVFHLAADFERSEEKLEFWGPNFRNNILASHYTLQQVMNAPSLKKIIFASSYLIYDKNLYNDPKKETYLKENDRIDPRNLCGIAKLQTERDIEFFHEQKGGKFDYASARIYRVYGRGSRDVISRWVRAGLKGEKITLFSKNNKFDYIFAEDVAEGLIRICKSTEAKGVINLGTGKLTNVETLVAILKEFFPNLQVEEIDKTIYPESSAADITRLRELVGWTPPTTLKEGIGKLIESATKTMS